MRKCRNCGQPIVWETFWTTWEHAGREGQLYGKLYAELCNPELGFDNSKRAER